MEKDKNSFKLHTYTYDVKIGNNTENRKLKFDGFSLKGNVDLTHLGKATGEAMWPCCALLADYISSPTDFVCVPQMSLSTTVLEPTTIRKNDELLPRLQILELGCGLGLGGTVASIRVGSLGHTVLTDGDLSVIERAKEMSKKNYTAGKDSKVSHGVLRWGDYIEMQKIKAATDDGLGFDFIVASDILYEKDSLKIAKDFALTVKMLLKDKAIDGFDPNLTFPKCIVAFQKRSIDVQLLYDAFHKVGFDNYVPSGDYCEDIFGERHDCFTCFTDKFLICFQPHQQKVDTSE